MKVYIVVCSSYSFREKEVVSVHATRKLANAEVRKLPHETLYESYRYEVETHDVEESE